MQRDSFICDTISSYVTACCSILWSLIFLVNNGSRRQGGVCVDRALHRVAASYIVSLYHSQEVGLRSGKTRDCVLLHVAVCCRLCASVVQRVAVYIVVWCSVLQCVAV